MAEALMEASDKLSSLDRSQLADLVPLHCSTICDAVAILYMGVLGKWVKVSSGVAALEGNKKDHKLHICLYSLTKRLKVFDIELYEEMNYTVSCCQFHSFSDDGGSYGLLFSNVNDSQKFFEHVNGFLKTDNLSDEATSKIGWINRKKFNNFFVKRNKSSNRKNDKKLNIEVKVNTFKHVSHIGLSQDAGFKVSAESEELANELIKALNLTINDEMEMQVVRETINKFGSDNVKEAMEQKRLKQQVPQPPSSQQRPPLPARPISSLQQPPPSSRQLPPPPLPARPMSSLQRSPSTSQPIPPPPIPPVSVPHTQSMHGELLDSIVNFNPNKLTKVNTAERKESAPDLMDSIENALIQMLNQRRGLLTQSDTDEDSDF
nr:wiskott Aldrich syndrome protein [Hymenolepis microstoma]